MVQFEIGFEVLPGTKSVIDEGDPKNPFQHASPVSVDE